MKVFAKRIFHEMDLYQYPDENMSYGLFPLGDGFIKNAPRRKDPERVHKKGDVKKWKFEVQEYCCDSMVQAIEREQITFESPIYFEHRDRNSEEKIQGAKRDFGAFITCACWPIQLMQMHYCHFCGKKIIIEERE